MLVPNGSALVYTRQETQAFHSAARALAPVRNPVGMLRTPHAARWTESSASGDAFTLMLTRGNCPDRCNAGCCDHSDDRGLLQQHTFSSTAAHSPPEVLTGADSYGS